MEIPTIKNSRVTGAMITGLALEEQILAISSRPTFLLLRFLSKRKRRRKRRSKDFQKANEEANEEAKTFKENEERRTENEEEKNP